MGFSPLSAFLSVSCVGMPFSSNLVYFFYSINIYAGLTFILLIFYYNFFCFAYYFLSLSLKSTYFDSCFQSDGSPIFLSSSLTPNSTIVYSLNLSQIYNIFLKSVFAFYLIWSLNAITASSIYFSLSPSDFYYFFVYETPIT